jgi:hypothetical protein
VVSSRIVAECACTESRHEAIWFVMAGLVPAVHAFLHPESVENVDARAGTFMQPAQAWLRARA